MDTPHFDALTRRLTLSLSRRRSLGLLGALGLGGLVAPNATEARKKCPPCKKRKQGKCKGKKPDGTACGDGMACQGGRCVVAPPFCQGKADFTECGGDKRCSGGVCENPPGCMNAGCLGNGQCCSDFCSCLDISPLDGLCDTTGICGPGGTGKPCNRGFDCTSGNCVGFTCQAA